MSTLTDQLDKFGDQPTDANAVLHLGRVQPEPFRSQMMTVARDLYEGQRLARAAAVRLRKLDAIEGAAGDVRRLRTLAGAYGLPYLDAIADALGGTEP